MSDRIIARDLAPNQIRIFKEAGEELRHYSYTVADWGHTVIAELKPQASTFEIRAALDPSLMRTSVRKGWSRIYDQTT